MTSRVVVIIVNYNGADVIHSCLQALSQQTFKPDAVHVVDNASSDDSVNIIKEHFDWVTLHCLSENVGFAAANNYVLKKLSTINNDWVALLNPDALPNPDWLEKLMYRAVNSSVNVAMFASQMRMLQWSENGEHNKTVILDGAGDAYHASGLCWRRGYGRDVACLAKLDAPLFAPCAAAALYRLSAVLEAGFFDENYFCYNEDVDLGFRLRLLDYDCQLVDDALVYHIGSKITGKNSDFSVYYGHRNLEWTYFKNMPLGLLILYLPQHLLMNVLIFLYYARQGRFKVITKAKWDAIKGLGVVWHKRRYIQNQKRVSSSTLKNLLECRFWRAFKRTQR